MHPFRSIRRPVWSPRPYPSRVNAADSFRTPHLVTVDVRLHLLFVRLPVPAGDVTDYLCFFRRARYPAETRKKCEQNEKRGVANQTGHAAIATTANAHSMNAHSTTVTTNNQSTLSEHRRARQRSSRGARKKIAVTRAMSEHNIVQSVRGEAVGLRHLDALQEKKNVPVVVRSVPLSPLLILIVTHWAPPCPAALLPRC